MNMDEATIATLPPNLMAEARRMQDNIRYERIRARDNLDNIDRRVRGMFEQPVRMAAEGRGFPYGDMFGRRPGANREEVKEQLEGGKSLEDAIVMR